MQDNAHETIVIIDYGSQYSQLIARRLREENVFCRIFSWRTPEETVMSARPSGFILSGGPNSVYDREAPSLPDYILSSGLPILGICYGMQLLTHHLGGKVAQSQKREYGPAMLDIEDGKELLFAQWNENSNSFAGEYPSGQVWMSHGDRVERLPEGFKSIAHTANSPLAAAADLERKIYCVQFHPEVAHTPKGRLLIRNFAFNVCGCSGDWTPAQFIEEQVEQLKHRIGKGKVLLGLSGGVDSSVTAALLHQAVGDQLVCVFVDHGLLRQGESARVLKIFGERAGYNLVPVNAVEEFMEALENVTDPEQKRRVIGEQFVRIFEREAHKLGSIDFLAQGTIYPDVIESASDNQAEAHTIKTHHNVGGLPRDMTFKLIEPLRTLFKDEVRRIGLELGLPEELVWRQPFPGPGLAIRCLGEVTWERLESLRAADAIYREELDKQNLLRFGTQQSFAVLLPVRSVGVLGDQRSYEEVIALRSVTTDDFMTADWARIPYDLLARASIRIVNEVPGVNRVVYDITSKPPGTIEWE
ncbi:MAG: glutamine-hydrolyzing GMP synthase [Candidatus Promineifilaceae bacterium]|jgi:GMP synthase (glutamine-hydrolysing)